MDDRRLLRPTSQPRVVRVDEFSRLGKSLLASAYERIVPLARVKIGAGRGSCPPAAGEPAMPARRAVA